jgi:hypothetical protein
MATLPSATIQIDDAAGASGAGSQVLAVCAPVPGIVTAEAALFSSAAALIEEHGFCQGAAYAALHYNETRLPILFVALPVGTAGAISHTDRSGVTGSSVISVAAGADGVLEAVNATLTVVGAGTIGTDQISFDLSLDGGFVTKRVRLGTASSYTVPYCGLVISFAAGTLVADDVFSFRSTGPTFNAAGATAVETTLAQQNVACRSWLMIGDAAGNTEADAVRAAAETYATADDRFVLARVQARDLYRPAALVAPSGRTVGASLTFAEVGPTGDTITRAAGSWVTDGFAVGDTIVVSGAVATAGANNITAVIATVTALVITLGSEDLVAEGPITSATVLGYPTLTFAEVGATADTITRSSGSFVTEGFKAGMTLTVDGTSLNDGTSYDIETVSALVLTMGTGDLAAEVISAEDVTLTAVETKADWRTSITDELDGITGDEARRIDLGAGYMSKLCPITGWRFRRPVQWAASLREYKHAEHIPTWRTADGALGGFTLEDANGLLAEHDERIDGGLLAAQFTCARTWNNKRGAFVAMSLTRADEGSLLSRTHNMHVANVACTTVQSATQNEIGQVLELGSTGLATEASLVLLESRVNAEVEVALRQDIRGEGPRASPGTVWAANRDDVLNVVGATLNGVLTLELNGTIEHIATRIAVPQAG